MKRFVIGDIHGAFAALDQCLRRSGFNHDQDLLISLGDVADGWPQTKQCVDELLRIKNLIYLLGNHDFWTLEWMQSGVVEELWYDQGGKATIDSYDNGVPPEHVDFLQKAKPYHVSHDNKLFVHAGINSLQPIEHQSLQTFLWDRNMARIAMSIHQQSLNARLTIYDEVFIGHTPVPYEKPMQCGEVWLMDTGAGWSGVLSMMDIDTKEIWTSDPVPSLYPGVKGRERQR